MSDQLALSREASVISVHSRIFWVFDSSSSKDLLANHRRTFRARSGCQELQENISGLWFALRQAEIHGKIDFELPCILFRNFIFSCTIFIVLIMAKMWCGSVGEFIRGLVGPVLTIENRRGEYTESEFLKFHKAEILWITVGPDQHQKMIVAVG